MRSVFGMRHTSHPQGHRDREEFLQVLISPLSMRDFLSQLSLPLCSELSNLQASLSAIFYRVILIISNECELSTTPIER